MTDSPTLRVRSIRTLVEHGVPPAPNEILWLLNRCERAEELLQLWLDCSGFNQNDAPAEETERLLEEE